MRLKGQGPGGPTVPPGAPKPTPEEPQSGKVKLRALRGADGAKAAAAMLKRLRGERSDRPPGNAAATGQPPPADAPSGEVVAPTVREGGDETVANFQKKVEQDKPRLASILAESSLTLKGGVLTIELPRQLENSGKVIKELFA